MTKTINVPGIEELVARVGAALPQPRGNVVGFIATGTGEGNSTVARAYATALTLQWRRTVLLLEAITTSSSDVNILHALAANQPLDGLLRTLRGGPSYAVLGDMDTEGSACNLVSRTDLWNELRRRFDVVVVDLPSTDHSHLGLTIAPQCDGVAVVIEAEKSRVPVVADLLDRLAGVRTVVLGTVLNSRRFVLPDWIYRKL